MCRYYRESKEVYIVVWSWISLGNVFRDYPVLLITRFLAILTTILFFDSFSSLERTCLHYMYWKFRFSSVVKIAVVVFIVIAKSFDTILSNVLIFKQRWLNRYVFGYEHPNATCTSTVTFAVREQSVCTRTAQRAVHWKWHYACTA